MNPVRLGDLLRMYRAAFRLTQAELAAEIGVARHTVVRLETGATASVHARTIAVVLGWLFAVDTTPERQGPLVAPVRVPRRPPRAVDDPAVAVPPAPWGEEARAQFAEEFRARYPVEEDAG